MDNQEQVSDIEKVLLTISKEVQRKIKNGINLKKYPVFNLITEDILKKLPI